jgi:ADP-heptose:LPS heptosyltransferase
VAAIVTFSRRRVLFIANNSLGDAVIGSGIVRRLVESEPEALLTIVAGPGSAPLFAETPRLEQLITLKKKSFKRHWLDLWLRVSARRWAIIVDMRGSALAYMLFAQERRVYRPVRQGSDSPQVHKVLQLASMTEDAARPPSPFLYTSLAQEARAEALVGGGPVLALAPAAKTPAKRWPAERFAEVAAELLDRRGPLLGGRVMLIGGAGEAPLFAPIRAAFAPDRVIEAFGLDLLLVYACLKRARLFIGNDSGPMHLAAAAGAPTLGLFGPTDARVYRPWGENAAAVTAARGPDDRGDVAALNSATVIEAALDLLEKARFDDGVRENSKLDLPTSPLPAQPRGR